MFVNDSLRLSLKLSWKKNLFSEFANTWFQSFCECCLLLVPCDLVHFEFIDQYYAPKGAEVNVCRRNFWILLS